MNNGYGEFSIFLSLFIPFIAIMWVIAKHIQREEKNRKAREKHMKFVKMQQEEMKAANKLKGK